MRDRTQYRVIHPASRIPYPVSRILVHRAALVAALACAGCGPHPWVAEGNYLTYDHAFTAAADAEVRRGAERICAQQDEVAVVTSRACSLTQCTTSYQCMNDAAARDLAGEKK